MLLQPGVMLFDETASSIGSTRRLTLSSGLEPAPAIVNNHRYCPSAIIPREPWREPTAEELQLLSAREPSSPPGSWISVVKIPGDVLEPFQLLQEAARTIATIDEMNEYIGTNDCQPAMEKFVDHCVTYIPTGRSSIGQKGIRANAPGLPTVTIDYRSSCLIGMHLDSWYMAPLAERHLSPNRIAVNLGREDRYLLYINLPLLRMAELIRASQSKRLVRPEYEVDLARPFAVLYPSYPVTRLRLSPGEAYIAPTENIIHDGSTTGMTTWDIHLAVLGRFEPSSHSTGVW